MTNKEDYIEALNECRYFIDKAIENFPYGGSNAVQHSVNVVESQLEELRNTLLDIAEYVRDEK